MASSGELARQVAETLTIKEPSVAWKVRLLREEGLLTKGGRGRSAAKMTSLDAARLLIAIMATETDAMSVDAVHDFGELICSHKKIDNKHNKITLDKLCGEQFLSDHNFESAISAIISGYSCDKFMAIMNDYLICPETRPLLPPIKVEVFESKLAALINICGNEYSYTHKSDSQPNLEDNSEWEEWNAIHRKWFRGIRITREVTGVELMKISHALI